jgi:hypothetical protein
MHVNASALLRTDNELDHSRIAFAFRAEWRLRAVRGVVAKCKGTTMAVRQVQYRGMTIKAAAFEVMGTGRFVVTLSIARTRIRSKDRKDKVFEPPSEDGFFDDQYEGLDVAIAFGREIVDGNVPNVTVDDL